MILISLSLVGCADADDGFNRITLGTLSAKLPKDLRPTESDYYDLYYTTPSCDVGIVRLDAARLTELNERADITLDEYVEVFLSANGVDREQSGLYFSPKQNAYRLTFLSSQDGVEYIYHNVVLAGGADAIYYVRMSCAESKAQGYEPTFEMWANSIRVSAAPPQGRCASI